MPLASSGRAADQRSDVGSRSQRSSRPRLSRSPFLLRHNYWASLSLPRSPHPCAGVQLPRMVGASQVQGCGSLRRVRRSGGACLQAAGRDQEYPQRANINRRDVGSVLR